MKQFTLIPYETWHYEYCAALTPEGQQMGQAAVRLYAQAYKLRGYAESIKNEDNKIVGCGGLIELWSGVGEVWSMFTDEAKTNPFFLHRASKRLVWSVAKACRMHRIQAIVLYGDPVREKWIEKLGLRREGRMEQASPNREDFGLWCWVKPCDTT